MRAAGGGEQPGQPGKAAAASRPCALRTAPGTGVHAGRAPTRVPRAPGPGAVCTQALCIQMAGDGGVGRE